MARAIDARSGGKKRGRWVAVMALVIVSLILLLQLGGLWRPLTIVLDGLTRPVGQVLSNTTRSVGGFFQTFGSLGHLGQDNQRLERDLQSAQAEISRLQEIAHENSLLREQLGFQKDLPLDLIGANVVSYSPDNVRRTFVINRGSRDGVQAGQAVVSSGVLVGKIERVDQATATVGLVSDPEFRIQAIGQSGRSRGILTGEIGVGLRLEQIAQNEIIDQGENVLTAGSDRIPKGILVGRTESVDKSDNEIFQAATVRSPLDFERLEIVFVVKQ